MITPEELHEIATKKKAEIDKATQLYREAEEQKIKEKSKDIVDKCLTEMIFAAKTGKFSTEVETGMLEEKVLTFILRTLHRYKAKSDSDGYTRYFIRLEW